MKFLAFFACTLLSQNYAQACLDCCMGCRIDESSNEVSTLKNLQNASEMDLTSENVLSIRNINIQSAGKNYHSRYKEIHLSPDEALNMKKELLENTKRSFWPTTKLIYSQNIKDISIENSSQSVTTPSEKKKVILCIGTDAEISDEY